MVSDEDERTEAAKEEFSRKDTLQRILLKTKHSEVLMLQYSRIDMFRLER